LHKQTVYTLYAINLFLKNAYELAPLKAADQSQNEAKAYFDDMQSLRRMITSFECY